MAHDKNRDWLKTRLERAIQTERDALYDILGPARFTYISSRVDRDDTKTTWLCGNLIFVNNVLRFKNDPVQFYAAATLSIFNSALLSPLTLGHDVTARTEPVDPFADRSRVAELATEVLCLAFYAVHEREPTESEYARLFEGTDAITKLAYPRGVKLPIEPIGGVDFNAFSANYAFNGKLVVTEITMSVKQTLKNLVSRIFNIKNIDDEMLYDPVFFQMHLFDSTELKNNVVDWAAAFGPLCWFWIHTTAARCKSGLVTHRLYALLASFEFALSCSVCRQHFNASLVVAQMRQIAASPSFHEHNLDNAVALQVYSLHKHVSATSVGMATDDVDQTIVADYDDWWTKFGDKKN